MTLEALPNTIYWKKEKRKGIKMGDKDQSSIKIKQKEGLVNPHYLEKHIN